jgi:carbamoyl-phosphate synthase large subunit
MIDKSVNILITAASRRVALVKDFKRALKGTGKVIAVDCDPLAAALYFSDKRYLVPLIADPSYLNAIKEIIEKEKINLIIPTIDLELLLWAENKSYFKKKGIHVSISPPKTIKTCNDKWETFRFFSKHDLLFAFTFPPCGTMNIQRFPLIIKPRSGRGSVDVVKVESERELAFYLGRTKQPIIQEYLPGKEFTVDAFFSRTGELISYVPRYRLVIRAGVSDRGETFKSKEIERLIIAISKKMKFEGAVNFQGKINEAEEVKFFEINPRFSGGIQLCTAAITGSFADLLIREMRGEALTPRVGEYIDRLTMTSFEDSLFLDSQQNLVEKNRESCY